MKRQFIFLILFILSPLFSFSQVIQTDERQEVESPKNEELPDSSPSAPTLETDDTGTPGPYGFEINLTDNEDITKISQTSTAGLDANFGLGETIQLRASKDAIRSHQASVLDYDDYGGTSAGVKWRFLDENSFKMALYPSYQFGDESRHGNEDHDGRSWYLPILISKTWGTYTLIGNLGFSTNLENTDKNFRYMSLALGHAYSDITRFMGEVTSKALKDGTILECRIGFTHEIFPNEKSLYETAIFGSLGRTMGWTDDGLSHTTALVGFAFAKKAK
jgi:hypothetical protein